MTKEFELRPYVTEKTSNQIEARQFTFLVLGDANKIEVGQYLTSKYDVNVASVNCSKKLSKKIRRGRIIGRSKSYKKVIVTLRDEKNIDSIKELF